MLINLPLASLSMSIDVATIISLILRIYFTKIHMDSEVVISMPLLFGRMLNLMKRFH